jgi:UDP-glucuronate 4-epimerase
MAYYSFTKAISEGTPINVYNSGAMKRDFTYVDDVIEGITKLIDLVPLEQKNETSNALAPFRILNIGNNNPVSLIQFIEAIESSLGKKAIKNFLPMQLGDVPITYADIAPFSELSGFNPNTPIEHGIDKFVKWYLGSN